MFKLAATVAAAVLISSVAAQDIPACFTNCTTTPESTALCGLGNTTCYCTSTEWQTVIAACVGTSCTPAEAAQAPAVEQALCGSGNSTASGSASGSASATGTGAAGGASGGATGSAATSKPTTGSATGSAAASSTSKPSAGFQTAGIASGVALAMFGAAVSLF